MQKEKMIVVNRSVIDIPYGRDLPTRTLLVEATPAIATVLLFPGGPGITNIRADGTCEHTHTFFRSLHLWSLYGINAVVVDSPYNLGVSSAGTHNERFGVEHMQRVRDVVEYYKSYFGLPVWMFGHSMSTTTLTAYANQNKDWEKSIDGLIFAGTHETAILKPSVMLPTLCIHHCNDGCKWTPVQASLNIMKTRALEVRAKMEVIHGGNEFGDPNMSVSYHGFYQKEEAVIGIAANFISRK